MQNAECRIQNAELRIRIQNSELVVTNYTHLSLIINYQLSINKKA